jgi:hypothetical protein
VRLLPALALSVMLLTSCRDSAFQAASKVDTIEAWRKFIAENPKDESLEAAEQRLSEVAFIEAQRTHSVVSYKRFLEEFPESEKATIARKLLEALRFNAAMERGTAHTLRQFLRDHPDGAHREEVDEKLAKIPASSRRPPRSTMPRGTRRPPRRRCTATSASTRRAVTVTTRAASCSHCSSMVC